MARIRLLIAAADPFLRRRLREAALEERDFDVVSECTDGLEADAELHRTRPEAMLLDASLPRRDGLELTRRLDPDRGPAVVLFCSDGQNAQEALDAGALDCVRKPVESQRLARAFQRLRIWVRSQAAAALSERLSAFLQDLRTAADYPARIPVPSDGRVVFLPVDEIDWIEGSGNYACLRSAGQVYRLRQTLSALERSLDPGRFRRIHRGVIVNLARIRAIEPRAGGSAVVRLRDGTTLSLSRGYRYVLTWLGADAPGAASREAMTSRDGDSGVLLSSVP